MSNTDLFGAQFSTVRGITRAGRGEITIGHGAAGTVEEEYPILAANIQMTYNQQLQTKTFAGGDVFAVVQMSQGQLELGAVVGPGIHDLLAASADLRNVLSANEYDDYHEDTYLQLSLEDPDLQGHHGYIHTGGMTYRLYNYFVQGYNLTSNPPDPPVMTQVSIFAMNVAPVASEG